MTLAAASINVDNVSIALAYTAAFFFILAVAAGVFDWICDSAVARYNAWVDRRNDADHIAWWSTRRLEIDVRGRGRR